MYECYVCHVATFTFLIFHTKFLITIKVPAHSCLDTDEDKMSRRDNFAFLPFFNEDVLPLGEEWMGGEDDQRRNALGTGGNQDVSTDGDIFLQEGQLLRMATVAVAVFRGVSRKNLR